MDKLQWLTIKPFGAYVMLRLVVYYQIDLTTGLACSGLVECNRDIMWNCAGQTNSLAFS